MALRGQRDAVNNTYTYYFFGGFFDEPFPLLANTCDKARGRVFSMTNA
jgi:hypothetical protein